MGAKRIVAVGTILCAATALVALGGCMCSPSSEAKIEVTASALEVEAGGTITLTAEAYTLGPGLNEGRTKSDRQPIEVAWRVTPSAGAGTGSCSPESGASTTFTSEDPGEYKIVGKAKDGPSDYVYVKVVPSTYLLNIGNGLVVSGGGTSPSFTIDTPHLITEMYSYNYGDGEGSPGPGTLALRAADGAVYGPWECTADEGQGGVPNALWFAYPDAEIPAGTYTVVNSNPETWSHNEQSGGLGFAYVKGTPVGE